MRPVRAALLAAVAAAGLACETTVPAGTSVRNPMSDASAGSGGAPGIDALPAAAADAGAGAGGAIGADATTTATGDAGQGNGADGAPASGLVISDPLALDEPVPVPGMRQADPAVGFDGEGYLIVFTDQRAGRPDWAAYEGELDVYGTRVRADGAVLDPGGFPIVTGFGDQHDPGIAFDGTNYLLVYFDYLPNPDFEDNVMGLRLDRDGRPIDAAPFPISTVPASFSGPPAVAFNGTDFLVGWAGYGGTFVRLIGKDGVPAGEPLLLSDSAGAPSTTHMSLATDGDGFLAVWGLSGRRVTAQGTAPDPAFPLTAAGDITDPVQVGYGGGVYLVAWSGINVDSRWVNATRVSAAGAVLDSPPLEMGVVPYETGVVNTPLVGGMAYDPGKGYFDLYWVSDNDLHRAFVQPDGTVNDGFGAGGDVPDTGATRAVPSVGFQNEQFFLAWRSVYPGDNANYSLRSGLFGHFLSDFNFGPTFPLVETANQELWPAAGSNGDGYLLVWSDTRNRETGDVYFGDVTDVYGARLDGAGRVLDPAGIAIARAPSGQAFPAVASDGDRYLVVWADARAGSTPGHIYGTFVTRDGAVTDSAGFQISDDANGFIQALPAVAWGGSSYLVTWAALAGLSSAGSVRGVLVSQQGEVIGPRTGFSVCGGCFNPKVAATTDGTFLVVSMQYGTSYEPTLATRISSAGVVLDPAGIVLDPMTANRQGVAVASDGNEFLAIWAGSLGTGADARAAARVSAGGGVLSTFSLPLANALSPSVTFDGGQYLVAWHQTRDDGSGVVNDHWRAQADDNVLGLRIGRSGELLDPVPFTIAGTSADEVSPALASNAKGTTVAAYTWPRLDPGFGSLRTGARLVTRNAP